MELVRRIRADLDAARRDRNDRQRVMLLSTLAGEAERVGKDAGNRATTDAEALAVVRKFVKNAEQTASDLEKAGRDVSAVRREIGMLQEYLPAAVPEADVEAAVREIASGMEEAGPKQVGAVIKALRDRYGDAFDGASMGAVARRVLAE